MIRYLLLPLAAACAQASEEQAVAPDARVARPDAMRPIDARRPDARVDAYVCTKAPTQVIANASFDGTGGWVQLPHDPSAPIVQAAPVLLGAPSAPNVAWMGGIVGSTEIMYQDVTIPAGTLQLTLAGKIAVDGPLLIPEDEAIVTIRDMNDTLLREVKRWDNSDTEFPFAEWGDFAYDIPVPATAQVRVHFVALNDDRPDSPTSFFFDDIALIADPCQ